MVADTPKLLVIDDEVSLRRSLSQGLAQRGYAIDEAGEGWPALKLVASSVGAGRPYRAVIAAMELPDIHGLKLLELIKTSYPTLPVILTVPPGSAALADAVTDRRGDACLAKPFGVDQLAAVLDRLPQSAAAMAAPPSARPTPPASAYALVRLRDGADRMLAFKRLHDLEHVTCCDAVHGDYDVALLLGGPDAAAIDRRVDTEIRAQPEVAAVSLLPLVRPELDPALQGFIDRLEQHRCADATGGHARGADGLATYLLVNIEPGRCADVFPRLCGTRGVVACDATSGEIDAVALIRTHSFDENKRILSEEIKRIDGIARARSMKVIGIYDI